MHGTGRILAKREKGVEKSQKMLPLEGEPFDIYFPSLEADVNIF